MTRTKTATAKPLRDIALTAEDVAELADGTGNIPDATARRLQALIRCRDPELLRRNWDRIGTQLEELGQMAEDAGVDLLVDGLYVLRILEQLRARRWEYTGDVLDPRFEVPYPELISMARARAGRAEGPEKAGLELLAKRLVAVWGGQIGTDEDVDLLIDRLLEVGEEVGEEALGQLVEMYRCRRKATRK